MKVALETPRLLLRELEEADLERLAALLGDPRVMRHWPRPLTREEAAIDFGGVLTVRRQPATTAMLANSR